MLQDVTALIRSFLWKRINDNRNLKVLNDLYFSVIDENLSSRQRYINSLLHTSVCVLHDCIHGTLFPYELVHWLATKIAYLECLTISRVDTSPTWLLAMTEDHWFTQYIYDKLSQQQFNTLATYVGFCREGFLTHYTCGGKNLRLKFQIIPTCTHLGIFSLIKSMISYYPDDDGGGRIDIGVWYDNDMECVMVSKPSSKIPTNLSRYNIVYMSKLPYLEIVHNDVSSSPSTKLDVTDE